MAAPIRSLLASSLLSTKNASTPFSRASFASSSKRTLTTTSRLQEPERFIPSTSTTIETNTAPTYVPTIGRSGGYGKRLIPFKGDKEKNQLRYMPIEPLVLPNIRFNPSVDFNETSLERFKRTNPHDPSNYVGGSVDAPDRNNRVTHELTIRCSQNNVHFAFIDKLGVLPGIGMGKMSTGIGGVFKGANKSSLEAATQTTVKVMTKIMEYAESNTVQICVAFKGLLGTQREAVAQAMAGPEGQNFTKLIVRVEDRSPILMGGCRPKGQRHRSVPSKLLRVE